MFQLLKKYFKDDIEDHSFFSTFSAPKSQLQTPAGNKLFTQFAHVYRKRHFFPTIIQEVLSNYTLEIPPYNSHLFETITDEIIKNGEINEAPALSRAK